MKKENPFKACEKLEARARESGSRVHNLESELRDAKSDFNRHSEDLCFLEGLKASKQKDPGKYCPAYYFVKEFSDKRVITSEKIALTRKCGTCQQENPVVVDYQQKYDSPEGDEWRARIYVLCPEHGLTPIHLIKSSNRII